MANQVSSNGSVSVTAGTLTLTNNISFNVLMTGSNVAANVQGIPTSAYTALDGTSSLSDIRFIIASNQDGTGSISLAQDGAGTKQIAFLKPGDSVLIPWTGSAELTAKAFGNNPTQLQFVVTEQ